MTDKMREAFEKWYTSQAVFHKSHLVKLSNDYYFGAVAETAWRAWQAARTVPEGFVMVPVEILQLIQCDVENSADWLSSATSALRNLLSAAPEGKK